MKSVLLLHFSYYLKKRITHLNEAIRAAHEDELFETNDINTLMKNLTE